MEHALPTAWTQDRRGFWTKRKKTAMSLFAVMALIAGIALAFKLFDQVVPNNVVRDASSFDFQVDVFRSPSGGGTPQWLKAGPPPDEPIFNALNPSTSEPISTFPGDSRQQLARIVNKNQLPKKDASFFVHVDPLSIVVMDCTVDPLAPNTCSASAPVGALDPNRQTFLNFWTLKVEKEKVLREGFFESDVNENDHGLQSGAPGSGDHDRARSNQYEEVCEGKLTDIKPASQCYLGEALAAGSKDLLNQPTDTRWYRFTMTEDDPGTDQSAFKGWTITWTFVFQARVPALTQSCVPICEE